MDIYGWMDWLSSWEISIKVANHVTIWTGYSFIVIKAFVKSVPILGWADNRRMARFSEQHSKSFEFSFSFNNINEVRWLFKIKMNSEKIPKRNLFRISPVHGKKLFVWIKDFEGYFCFVLFCFRVVASFKISKAEWKLCLLYLIGWFGIFLFFSFFHR